MIFYNYESYSLELFSNFIKYTNNFKDIYSMLERKKYAQK